MTVETPGGRGPRIDEVLQKALNVDPSPDFVARVRTRIADEPAPRGWHSWWLVPAVALAAAVVLAVSVARSPQVAPNAGSLEARALPPIDVPAIAPRLAVQAPASREGLPGARPVASTGAAAPPLVLIDSREARVLRAMVFGPPLKIEQPYVGPTLTALEIAPLVIEPLPTGSEGERQ